MSKFNKKSSGKIFYITVAIALFAVAASVFAMRYTSNKLTEVIPDETVSRYSDLVITTEAGNEVSDVPDTREEEMPQAETEEETTEKPTETTQEITEKASAQISNAEFFMPLGEAKPAKEFSPTRPVQSKTMGDWRVHNGVDFEAKEGEEIHSVGNGVVTKVISDPKWGYVIEVDHGSFTARYCSVNQEDAVGIGTALSAGDVIGRVAAVPIESADGAHLHFETIKDGKYIDPSEALNS